MTKKRKTNPTDRFKDDGQKGPITAKATDQVAFFLKHYCSLRIFSIRKLETLSMSWCPPARRLLTR